MSSGNDAEVSGEDKPEKQFLDYRRVVIFCGLATALTGILGLAGLLFGLPLLTSVLPGLKPIALSAAIAWIILGLSLVEFVNSPFNRRMRNLVIAIVFFVTAASALELPLNILGSHFLTEPLFIKAGDALSPLPSTPISPLAVFIILLSSSSLLLLLAFSPIPNYRGQVLRVTGFLGTLSALFSFTILLSYLYGNPFLYGTVMIPIAIVSTLAGLFTSLGLIFAAGPESFPLRHVTGSSIRAQILRIFLPLIVIIILVESFLVRAITTIPYWGDTISVTGFLVFFTVITVYVAGKISGIFSANLEREEQKRNLAEAALRESEERFRSTFENSMVGMCLCRPDFTYESANSIFCSMVGYTEAELQTMTFADITHPDHVGADIENVKKLQRGEIPAYKTEKRYIRKNGTVFWASITVSVLSDPSGHLKNMLAVVEDITERMEAESALTESERRYRNLYQYAQVGLFETSLKDGLVVACNQRYADLFGAESIKATIGQDVRSIYVNPEDRDTVVRILRETGQINDHVVRFRNRLTGRLFWGQFSARYNYECDVAEGTIIDITAQKDAEDLIRETNEILNKAQTLAHVGSWQFDLVKNAIVWSDETYRVFGYKPGTFDLTLENIRKVIHPDDLEKHDRIIADAIATGHYQQEEYRLIRPDGSVRVISGDGQAISDNSGKVVKLVGVIQDLTERKQAEDALRESEVKLRRFYDSGLFGVIFWTMDGKITDANDKFLSMVGFTRDDLKAGRIDWLGMTPPMYRQADEASVLELRRDGINKVPFEKEYIRKDGSRIPILIAGAMLDEQRFHGVAFVLDITERNTAEIALKESEEKYRELFENITAGFALHEILLDDQGKPADYRFLIVNPAFEEMTGLRGTDIVNRTVLDVLPGTESSWIDTYGQVALTGTSQVFENYSKNLGKWFEVRVYSPKRGQFATVFTDITGRRAMERQREALIKELEQKNAELERFNYTVSHDLKSPLITIKGFAGLLEDDSLKCDPVQLKKDVQRITAAADTMQQLLTDVLELSRIGRIVSPPENTPFGTIAREAVELLAGPLAERAIAIRIDPDMPMVNVDHARIREVLVNLIENAIKFTANRPDPEIRIGVDRSGGEPVFFVQDNGIGIDPRYLERIFNLFEKLNPSIHGTGVGLTIVRRIIEVHGGKIWAESGGYGKGAIFRFTLPGLSGGVQ
jgi:PAS domain S-box-containing protein